MHHIIVYKNLKWQGKANYNHPHVCLFLQMPLKLVYVLLSPCTMLSKPLIQAEKYETKNVGASKSVTEQKRILKQIVQIKLAVKIWCRQQALHSKNVPQIWYRQQALRSKNVPQIWCRQQALRSKNIPQIWCRQQALHSKTYPKFDVGSKHSTVKTYPKFDVGSKHSASNGGKPTNHDRMQLRLGHQWQEGTDQNGGFRLQHNIPVEDLQYLCCYLYQNNILEGLQHQCWLFIPRQHPSWGFATSMLIIFTNPKSLLRVCNISADYVYQHNILVEDLQHPVLIIPIQNCRWGFATSMRTIYICVKCLSHFLSVTFMCNPKSKLLRSPGTQDIFLISLWLPCLQSGSQTMVTKPSVLAFTVEMCYTQQQLTEGHTHWDRHYEKKIKSLLSKYHAWLWHLHESLTQTFCEEFSTEKILNYLKATDIFGGIYIFRSYQLRLCFIYTSF